jgi:hypothetical protein
VIDVIQLGLEGAAKELLGLDQGALLEELHLGGALEVLRS